MNLENAKKEFLNYANNYDLKEFQIKRKLDHSLRVMALSRKIAESLHLNSEEIEIATLIGLLHDIARFEQYTVYKTFNDSKSIDHGNFGVKILQNNNYIRNFINEEKYDRIIFIAIKNHNKFKIEEGLSKEEVLFSKIIRDADKIDILYQGISISWTDSVEKVENKKISEEDIQAFREKRLVNRNTDLKHTPYEMRHLLTSLGFVFDINFNISFKILKETDYINKTLKRFSFKDDNTKELIEEVRNIVNSYIDEKQKG